MAPQSVQPSLHRRPRSVYRLQWFACFPLTIAPSHVGIWTMVIRSFYLITMIWTSCNTWFIGPTRVRNANGNLIVVCSLNKNKKSTCFNKMIFDNKEISEPSEICNKLNNYFCSIGTNLVRLLNPGGNIDFMKYIRYSNKNSMCCSPVIHQMK